MSPSWYVLFNACEGALWMIAAGVLAGRAPRSGPRQEQAVRVATVALLMFGVSDWLECRYEARIPLWLWGFKVACGVALLVARFQWRGWNQFRISDREVLFGLFCLMCVAGLIVLQRSVG